MPFSFLLRLCLLTNSRAGYNILRTPSHDRDLVGTVTVQEAGTWMPDASYLEHASEILVVGGMVSPQNRIAYKYIKINMLQDRD